MYLRVKNIKYLILFLLIFSACKKEEQLEVDYSELIVKESANVQNITFLNTTVGFACGGIKGETGAVYKTMNGGSSWQKIFSVSGKCIYDVSFVNDTLGYACGENLLLLRTTDGGINWVDQSQIQGKPTKGYNSTLRKIVHIGSTAYVSGGGNFSEGVMYKTFDGGNWWLYNIFDNELRGACFINKYTGYFAAYGTIYRTNDSTYSFNKLSIDNDFFVSIDFVNTNTGYACGYNGGIYKTTDGGNSWKEQLKNNNDVNHTRHFNQLKFINENEGYAVGNNGLIMYTDNGGNDWKKIKKITEDHLYSLYIKDHQSVFITSSGGKIYLLHN